MITQQASARGNGGVRQTVGQYSARTAQILQSTFGAQAITSVKDPRLTKAFAAAKNMGHGISSKDLGDDWEPVMSMLPGTSLFELTGPGPRATRQILSINGESSDITLTATYADGKNRVFDTIRASSPSQVSHDVRRQVDNQG
jgi:hypothetical protein